jgi:hypothetical protein
MRGILGVSNNVSFYVTYPFYDDEIQDYDIALLKVSSAILEVRLLSLYQYSAFISLSECAHLRQQNQGTQSHCIIKINIKINKKINRTLQ